MEQPEGSLSSSLQNVLDQTSLKWIFVGGKGGVGKTTVSCSLAILLCQVRQSVLLISTDPAHNLSDCFSQKFSKKPTKVLGFDNLSALEIDPNMADDDEEDSLSSQQDKGVLSKLATAMPGIDEAMGFSKVLRLVESMEFDVVVFDTAPTGHTLRFLQFPQTLLGTFGTLFDMQGALGGVMAQMMAMMGQNMDQMDGRLAATKRTIEKVSQQFQDPNLTTFVAVTIAEFLPLYETERLLQELANFNMDCRNIVVNQILDAENSSCEHCKKKAEVQQNYLGQMDLLYKGLFHVTYLPALTEEVRGVESLKSMSKRLVSDNSRLKRK